MASLTANALCVVPTMAAAAAPRRHRSLVVARASAAKVDDAAGGRRRAMVLLAAVAATTASTAAAGRSARAAVSTKTGQWAEIENVSMEPYVQDLGKWAVTEHNKQSGEGLEFGKVVRGRQQVVAGMNYSLEIETKGPASRFYEAGPFVSLPPEKRQLKSFTPLLG